MKRVFLVLMILLSSLSAELTNVWANPSFIASGVKIIDIRTPSEWRETGVIKGSYQIMFFDEKGNFDVKDFLTKLNKIIKKDEKFALVCRVGSRTGMVSKFLSQRLNYNVVNLKGGIMKLIHEGYKTTPYKK